jgi:hypothetical protein
VKYFKTILFLPVLVFVFSLALAQDDTPVFTDKDLNNSNGSGLEINSGDSGTNSTESDCDTISNGIKELRDGGLITAVENNGHKFFVGEMWYALTIQQKENLAQVFATYAICQHEDSWAEVYDGHSGKKLAGYSIAGFTNYEK